MHSEREHDRVRNLGLVDEPDLADLTERQHGEITTRTKAACIGRCRLLVADRVSL
jgi:hypothetical protein